MQISDTDTGGQQATEGNSLDIAGFKAIRDPREFQNWAGGVTREESDAKSLAKLHYVGLDVDTLDAAHERFRISPVRYTTDLYRLLGHAKPPTHGGAKDGKAWFTEDYVTSLAFQFPNPQVKGAVYPHTRIVRVRYPQPLTLTALNKKNGKAEVQVRKYDQPMSKPGDGRSTSEPYFLCKPDGWVRVFDVHRPLYITESELKAVALGLTGLAAVGFSGANMWGAAKGKKHQLHPSLDPNGPWGAKNTIPVAGRHVVVMFDNDASANALVRDSAKNLAKALLTAGAVSVKIAALPAVVKEYAGTGPDDFLYHHLGPRWAGDAAKIQRARELVEEVADAAPTMHSTSRYKAYSVVRTAERVRERLGTPASFSWYETDTDGEDVCLRVYDGAEYVPHLVTHGVGSTSGKVVITSVSLQNMARDGYEEGVTLDIIDNGDDPKMPEMPTDFPNKLFAEVRRQLPRFFDNHLLSPIPGFAPGDKIIRVKNGLINLNKCVLSSGAWDTRAEWLFPPDHRWLSGGCLDIALPNSHEPPTCPEFLKMLENGFDGDQERIECLRRFMGKCLVNPVLHRIQKIMCMYGRAGSGKSTVVHVLTKLVGLRAVKAMSGDKNGDFETGDLPGKRLVVFSEVGDDSGDAKFSPAAAGLLKSITSGDPVRSERKGVNVVTAFPTPEIILVGNTPPVIPMDKGAWERRAIFLRWTNKIAEPDSAVHERIMTEELPGIFLWAMQGAAELARLGDKGLATPSYCTDDLQDTTEQVDPENEFVRTQLRIKAGAVSRLCDVQALYDQWATISGVPKLKINSRKIGHTVFMVYEIKSKTVREGNTTIRAYYDLEIVDPQLKKLKDRFPGRAFY